MVTQVATDNLTGELDEEYSCFIKKYPTYEFNHPAR